MTENKKDIRSLSKDQLKEFFVAQGEKAFRAQQVYEWLWKKSLKNFDEMTNISLPTRELLKAHFTIKEMHVSDMQRSTDGTIKNAMKLHDGLVVESVLIPTEKRITACISSQVGCSLDCTFCATARLKRMRNLEPSEIYDQVVTIQEQAQQYFGRPLTNIVFMGMGEPLLNYKNVLEAVNKITKDEGLGMGARRITLSTVGLPKMIKKLADEDTKINLAVSLHSAINETRDKLMPINQKNDLQELAESLKYWYENTGRRVTYEYVVWKGINDSRADAKALAEFCAIIPCKVNLIEYNPIDDGPYQQASAEAIDIYTQTLERKGIIVNVRRSRGKDIDAACGQLANKS